MLRQRYRCAEREQQETPNHRQQSGRRGLRGVREMIAGAGQDDHDGGSGQDE